MTKSNDIKIASKDYDSLISQISQTYLNGKQTAVNAVNSELVSPTGKLANILLNSSKKEKNEPNMEVA